MYFRILAICITPLVLLSIHVDGADSENKLVVSHYQKNFRYQNGLELLDLALSKLNMPYEIVALEGPEVNEARGQRMVIAGQLDVQFMSTNAEREEILIPVKIPIYRGILGLRLLLVNKRAPLSLLNTSSLEGLRRFMGGHGEHWGDLPVYPANELQVVTSTSYETLFTLLEHNRFDYFHRGIFEIWGEVSRHSDKLMVMDGLMLFYPHPVYFFVTKQRPELASLIEDGLNTALSDGSFKELFLKQHSEYIQKSNLADRKLIVLTNPAIPAGTPKLDTSWWLPEQFQGMIR